MARAFVAELYELVVPRPSRPHALSSDEFAQFGAIKSDVILSEAKDLVLRCSIIFRRSFAALRMTFGSSLATMTGKSFRSSG